MRYKGQCQPKTPESGGIPLPYSWPPFARDTWDDRARSLLMSLSRMGHEEEDYVAVPAAINMTKDALSKAQEGREESSISLGKLKKKQEEEGGGAAKQKENGGDTKKREGKPKTEGEEEEDHEDEETPKAQDDDDEEDEDEGEKNRLPVKPTKALKTYEQRRKFIVKTMDLHRHTIGGGRSGRRGRAECVAFFRRVLEILDEQYADELDGLGESEEEGVKQEEFVEEEEESSSSEEEEEEEEIEGGDDDERQGEQEKNEAELEEEEEPKSPSRAAAAYSPTKRKGPGRPPKKGPGRPRKSESATTPIKPTKPKKPKKKEAVPTIIIKNEQDFFDQHNDFCEVCNQPGELLCCATCNLVFHVKCARPKLSKEPPDDWKCAYCWASGVMGGKKEGKERRKAAQCCREMERMRRKIKEARARGEKDPEKLVLGPDPDPVDENEIKEEKRVEEEEFEESEEVEESEEEDESEEEEESEEEDEEEDEESEVEERRPAAKKPGPKKSTTPRGLAAAMAGGQRATLAQAASAGCRKCTKELNTGEKTRKVHDDWCPRKWKSVGKPPSSMPEEDEQELPEEDDDEEEPSKSGVSSAASSRSTSPVPKRKVLFGGVSLAEAAAAGCNKCKRELDTGEKDRKTHSDHCPRKYRGAYKGMGSAGPPPVAVAAAAVAVDVVHEKKPAVKKVPKDIASQEDAPIPAAKRGRKPGRPSTGKKAGRPSSAKRAISPKNPVSLADAAAAGCPKCRKELETGEKTRKVHADHCPRKWRSAGKPPKGMPSPASDVAAALRKAGESNLKSPPEAAMAPAAAAAAASPPRSGRRGKRTREQMVEKPIASEEFDEDEAAIEALGDLAEATAKEAGDNSEEQEGTGDEEMEDADEAENLKGGGFKLDSTTVCEANAKLGDVGMLPDFALSSTAMPAVELKSKTGDHEDDIVASDNEVAESLRGGGRTKNDPVKMEEGESMADQAAGTIKTPSTPINSGASTPRELEGLTVPTPLKLGDEHELTWSERGRVQRSRKKPDQFIPTNGPDSEWRNDEDNNISLAKKLEAAATGPGEVVKEEPEALRGGARPKKEDTPAAAEEAGSPGGSPPPRGPGRPPATKQTKGTPSTKKKNAKRAPIKKETNDSVQGVGSLNRKPGTLFDCPVCLDINKIKMCCYCACRVCFNKFGKEETMLCDRCDQEYHTFCVGLDKIPDGEWECPACIDDDKKKKLADQRKKEREAKRKIEDEKHKEEEAKKAVAVAKRRAAYAERKKEEEERKRVQQEKRKLAYEKHKAKKALMKAQGITTDKSPGTTPIITRKRGPGRPPKAETLARMQTQMLLQQQQAASAEGQPAKRGRGRPRKDGSAPIPRKLTQGEISASNLYIEEASNLSVERSRSGRKIQRTAFHDEVDGGGLMKRPRTDEGSSSMYVAERSAAAAAKSAIAGKGSGKKEHRRKPGARECMIITRKFDHGVIEQGHFDTLMDYARRGKVEHLIRLRGRLDEHSRFLESQLAGLESIVKEKGEFKGKVPPAQP